MNYDAIVIGGGIVGMSIGYHLVCAGARTLLIDRADPGRATDAGAGILAPETNSRDPEAWFTFAEAAVGYYPELIERLRDEQAGETGYAVCGQLIVTARADEDAPFAEARRHVFERQRRRSAPGPDELREVSPDEARALFPPLAPVHGARERLPPGPILELPVRAHVVTHLARAAPVVPEEPVRRRQMRIGDHDDARHGGPPANTMRCGCDVAMSRDQAAAGRSPLRANTPLACTIRSPSRTM